MAASNPGAARLEIRATVCRIALWAFLVVNGLSIVLLLTSMARALHLADPPVEIETFYILTEALLQLLLLLTAIPVCFWIHRAHANLREGGVAGLTYSPAWAVGSLFVPIANLFVPMRAMRELYNRSHGEPEHFAASSVSDVASWWSCHMGAVLVYILTRLVAILPYLTNVSVVTPVAVAGVIGLLNLLLWAGSAIYLLRVIKAVTLAQYHGVAAASVFD